MAVCWDHGRPLPGIFSTAAAITAGLPPTSVAPWRLATEVLHEARYLPHWVRGMQLWYSVRLSDAPFSAEPALRFSRNSGAAHACLDLAREVLK